MNSLTKALEEVNHLLNRTLTREENYRFLLAGATNSNKLAKILSRGVDAYHAYNLTLIKVRDALTEALATTEPVVIAPANLIEEAKIIAGRAITASQSLAQPPAIGGRVVIE